jgi:hypothetical protein
VSFAGVAIAAATLVLSLLVGKLGIALPALGPYLALIFAQVGFCWVILFVETIGRFVWKICVQTFVWKIRVQRFVWKICVQRFV